MSQPASDDFQPGEFSERVTRAGGQRAAKTLRGFALGRSPDDNEQWRLYLNADLTHFLEFNAKDTLHAEEVKPGHTLVWVRQGVRVTETTSRTLPVEFLQGQVRSGFLRGVAGLTNVTALAAEGCPCSGCAHCTQSCSLLTGGDSVGLSCGC